MQTIAAPALLGRRTQRVVIVMIDGCGLDYWQQSSMPVLHKWADSGIFKAASDVMPSVTNANNASLCCGCYPATHGITGNSYLNGSTGREEFMESGDLVTAPTVFERAAKQGIESALLSAKKKTISLLQRGASVVLTAEEPLNDWIARLGPAPGIYTKEINWWVMKAAIDLLKTRRDVGCLYVHTTDYPMHMWPPGAVESKDHLAKLDGLIGEAGAAAPDAAFLVTADHGMNHKRGCWDLERAAAARGVPIRMAISAERDKYVKHHRGFGGTAWVYLKSPSDEQRVAAALGRLPGIELVLNRNDAAARFRLMPSRIGDLVVLGDASTVFGALDREFESLPGDYRSHGSLHESRVPLLLHNAAGCPEPGHFESNVNLADWLYRPARRG